MKSYLHRMAANALSRERSIHPVLGSLWASQQNANSFEASGETLVPGTKPQRAQNAEQIQAQVQPVRVDSVRIEQEQRPAERGSDVMPRTGPEAVMPIHPSSETQRVAAISTLPRIAPLAESDGGLQTVRSEPQRNFRPLVPESSERAQTSQNVAVPAAAAPRVDSHRRQALAQPKREPDSIEIHIGRIEVLAAQPQPAQRPPAQPTRKSLDLGEYLRRGGGTR
jgi:hypothetical protein